MTLTYKWEHMPKEVLNENAQYEPIYHLEYGEVEYEYYIDVTINDLIAYLTPDKFDTLGERMNYKLGLKKMFEFLDENGCIELEELETDEYFVKFMYERHEKNAMEEYKYENGIR